MGHPKQIPLTPTTDPDSFPKWEENAPPGRSGHPYPKMLTREFLESDVEEWRRNNVKTDDPSGKPYFIERIPRLRGKKRIKGKIIDVPGDSIPILASDELVEAGYANLVGEPVIVRSAEEEVKVRAMLGLPSEEEQTAEAIVVPLTRSSPELAAIEDENKRLRAALEERAKLQAQLGAPATATAPRIDGRSKAARAAKAKANAPKPAPASPTATAKAKASRSLAQMAGVE